MLTGRRPFDRNTPVATALAQVNDPPPPLPDHVTGTLRSLVEQCLDKRPESRPASARELGERLGLPDAELGDAGRVAVEVVGTAARAETRRGRAGGPDPDARGAGGARAPAASAPPHASPPVPGRRACTGPGSRHRRIAAAALVALALGRCPASTARPPPARPARGPGRREHHGSAPPLSG